MFLTDYHLDYLLKKNGLKISNKEKYKNHSFFYTVIKNNKKNQPKLSNKYNEYKKIFNDFIFHHKTIVNDINKKIIKTDLPTYLFGAHIFSQYLIAFGLKTNKIVSILDNSPLKQGKRLYGTNLKVKSPKILKSKVPINVILRAGIYNEEIKNDILQNINNQAIFW
jgi:hypothetical protein